MKDVAEACNDAPKLISKARKPYCLTRYMSGFHAGAVGDGDVVVAPLEWAVQVGSGVIVAPKRPRRASAGTYKNRPRLRLIVLLGTSKDVQGARGRCHVPPCFRDDLHA